MGVGSGSIGESKAQGRCEVLARARRLAEQAGCHQPRQPSACLLSQTVALCAPRTCENLGFEQGQWDKGNISEQTEVVALVRRRREGFGGRPPRCVDRRLQSEGDGGHAHSKPCGTLGLGCCGQHLMRPGWSRLRLTSVGKESEVVAGPSLPRGAGV